ncbi:hypothetical protein [Halorhabdus rudnickae]|uniref:hypothetical protein n=1 Tax=Halorhabdus rudnickae TaxID=1775544 RepID=UPI001082613D|nr:hypothetical protein [Halorhabdus rudnickae]
MRSIRTYATRLTICVLGLVVLESIPVVAQSDGDSGEGGGVLGDIIIGAIQELLRILFTPIRTVIETHGDAVLQTVVGTPHPDAVFNQPTNGAWPTIHGYYWDTIIPLTLSLFGLAIGVVIFLESTSHLFNGFHRSKLKKRAFAGLLGVLSWWWIAALSLQFMDALSRFLIPTVADVTLFQELSFGGMGVLGTVVALSANFLLFILIGLIYLARHVALYLFVLLMPLLIVFWIPGVGPFSLVSKFMKKLAGFYVPFLFMTVPVALLFRLGDLLGTSIGPSAGEFGAWLTALIIPLLAVVSPLVLFWQAGALFFMADRVSQHMSAQRARTRVSNTRGRIQTTKQGGKNFARGVRDQPAVATDGQYLLNSGNSRAHATGQRLNQAGSRLRDVLGNSGDGGTGGNSGSTSPTSTTEGSGDGDQSQHGQTYDRSQTDQLRDPQSRRRDRHSRDEQPRYIH